MKIKNKLIPALFAASVLMLSFATPNAVFAAGSKPDGVPMAEEYSMDISDYAGMWKFQKDSNSYALTGVVYCATPVDTACESMNIYVPAVYMNADGTMTGKVFNGYTADTAPIIYANGVGGYFQATPQVLSADSRAYSELVAYLEKGYVLVSVGARGKDTRAEDGTYTGKSPAGLVDLKAGVRFLKHNDRILAGDSEKIISVGGSAGGAMSALLGATGNAEDYLPYLKEIGAVMTSGDDVYGAMCYCPITDIENADMAYEWMYQGHDEYAFMETGTHTPFQQALSADLAAGFPSYVNGLELDPDGDGTPLSLAGDRSGTYYDYLLAKIGDALAVYLTRNYSVTSGGMSSYTQIDTESVEKYIAELNRESNSPWVSVSYAEESVTTGPSQMTFYKVIDKVAITSLDAFIENYRGRGKMCPAFDDLTLGMFENQEFGSETDDAKHFDPAIAALLKKNADKYAACANVAGSDYNYTNSLAEAYGDAIDKDLAKRVALLNPMNYIGKANETCDAAPFFRIRVGTQDEHTSFTVAMNLALALETYTDATVDYHMIWNEGHGSADYEGDLTAWIERICKTEATYTGEQIEKILNLANSSDHGWEYVENQGYYLLKPVVDVVSPELPDYQGISIAVPGAYMNPDFTINPRGTVNGYTAATAPIILNTGAAGFSSSTTGTAGASNLQNGYINVSCGNRGKQNTAVDARGETYYCGDAPYCLVDQKAAVRWLKYNIALGNVPGCPDRIVTRGGSGGGAHSIMMAAMGNHPDFYPYLEKIGTIMSYTDSACKTVNISDAVFGCEPNSPITSLEVADIAYEWQYGLSTNDEVNRDYLSPFRRILSQALVEQFVDYVNSLGLKDEDGNSLTINADGKTGSYVDYYEKQLISSLEWYLNNLNENTLTWFLQDGESYAEAYINGHYYKAAGGMMGAPGGGGYLGGPGGNDSAEGPGGMPMAGMPDSGMGMAPGGGMSPDSGMPGGTGGMGMPGGPGMGNTGSGTAAPDGPNGTDLSGWISIKKSASGHWIADFKIGDWQNYADRSRTTPSFDDLDLDQTENQVFGDADQDYRHWDVFVLKALTGKYHDELKEAWTPGETKHANYDMLVSDYEKDLAEVLGGDLFGKNIVALYNPERYIPDEETEMPKHVRIIYGTMDTATSHAVPMNSYLQFVMRGVDATLAWSWDEGHVGADPLNTSFVGWLDGICKKQ
jgi:hypothetical protein